MTGRLPTLIAYSVKESRASDQKPFWTRIGAAWAHGKGTGYLILLDALPMEGRIVLVEAADAKAGAGQLMLDV